MERIIYRLKGQPLGFTKANRVYDIYGRSLGWLDGLVVYNKSGNFVGKLYTASGNHYILKFILDLQPLPQQPKDVPDLTPGEFEIKHIENIVPIEVPPGYVDGF